MSNRVLLGKIDSSDYGLIVSKEGVDVTTANEDELIFDSRSKGYGQVIFKETITLTRGTSQTRTFASESIPNPAIIIFGDDFVQVSNITGTQATFLVPNNFPTYFSIYTTSSFNQENQNPQPPASTSLTYAVIRGHI
jgi:hypothetical protein